MKKAVRPYSSGEEVANAVTHVVGSHLGAAMLALLVWKGAESGVDVPWKTTAGAIFGFSMILLYAISSAYHTVTYLPAKRVLHVMDHMAIYFLIAGTYTPFCLVTLRPDHPGLAWTIFGIEWGGTLAGIIFKIRTTGRFRLVSTVAYVVMGWVATGSARCGLRSAADSTRSAACSTSGSRFPTRTWCGTSSSSPGPSATSSAYFGM